MTSVKIFFFLKTLHLPLNLYFINRRTVAQLRPLKNRPGAARAHPVIPVRTPMTRTQYQTGKSAICVRYRRTKLSANEYEATNERSQRKLVQRSSATFTVLKTRRVNETRVVAWAFLRGGGYGG